LGDSFAALALPPLLARFVRSSGVAAAALARPPALARARRWAGVALAALASPSSLPASLAAVIYRASMMTSVRTSRAT
jgi:hypothetical protein